VGSCKRHNPRARALQHMKCVGCVDGDGVALLRSAGKQWRNMGRTISTGVRVLNAVEALYLLRRGAMVLVQRPTPALEPTTLSEQPGAVHEAEPSTGDAMVVIPHVVACATLLRLVDDYRVVQTYAELRDGDCVVRFPERRRDDPGATWLLSRTHVAPRSRSPTLC
jgi:hypothetical protein